jgi:hypothetical protein
VRTSATTGYYVDIFRSRTAQSRQFHDYLYHNLGDTLTLSAAGQPLTLAATPDRFRPAAGTAWSRNRSYLFPGWHVFKKTHTSAPFAGDVAAEFTAAKLKPTAATMRLFIPGTAGREYASTLAPVTKEAPSPYEKSPTPVLVIRQRGEAWDRPFAVIYEPRSATTTGADGGIQSVTTLTHRDRFAGFKITSRLAGRTTTQLVLTLPAADSEFADATLGLTFRGRYAVISLNDRAECTSLYLGEGTHLRFKAFDLSSNSGARIAAFVDLTAPAPLFTGPATASLKLPDGRHLNASRP